MSVFDDTDALPLFSGMAVRVTVEESHTPIASSQQMTFSRCPTCHDTGKVGDCYCWCQADQDARKLAAELAETQVGELVRSEQPAEEWEGGDAGVVGGGSG